MNRITFEHQAYGSCGSTLVQLLEQASSIKTPHGGYIFMQQGETQTADLSFDLVAHRARAVAAQLLQRQAAGERVLLMYAPGLDFIVGLFGCLYAGAIAVPLYPPVASRNIERLNAVVADCAARFVLTTQETQSTLRAKQLLSPQLRALEWLDTDRVDLAAAAAWECPDIDSATVAYLQYTSGSTAAPKGVVITHENAVHNCALLIDGWDVDGDSVMVSWLPHFHDFGLVSSVLMPAVARIPSVLMPPAAFVQKPVRWLKAIQRYQGTHTGAPNFAYQLCVDRVSEEDLATLDLSTLRVAVNGAEPIRIETMRDFTARYALCGLRPTALCPGYGLAETVLKVSTASPDLPATEISLDAKALAEGRVLPATSSDRAEVRNFVGCGVPRPGVDVRIVDPITHAECPPANVGEIWVASPSVASAYWNRPEESAAVFHARIAGRDAGARYLRTGDLGFLHDGEVVCAGRQKDLIIVRGGNHYPQDIEATAAEALRGLSPGAGAAFSIDAEGEERLVVVQGVDRRTLDPVECERAVRVVASAIAEVHGLELHAIAFIAARNVPRTSSGKIQRGLCKRAYLERSLSLLFDWVRPAPAAPAQGLGAPAMMTRPAVRAWLIERLAAHTGQPAARIDADEPFSSFGIDSAGIVRLAGEIAQSIDATLEPSLLFSYPTVNALADYLCRDALTLQNGTTQAARRSIGVSVIGIGCRFPGAHGPEAFWDVLRAGKVAIRDVPPDRWDGRSLFDRDHQRPGMINTTRGGFIEDVDRFDAGFFKISPREAARMDPQQRLLLETVWEALENAGIPPASLAGREVGVFVGIGSSDYSLNQLAEPAAIDAYAATGNSHSMAAGRLSYFFDLHGPSVAVDTACSSSLVAVHLACRSLQDGECSLAIVAGANLVLRPEWSIALAKAGMLSTEGWCNAFDAAASGYVRGEGIGVVVLKAEDRAVADDDHIWATILGSAINQDGRSNGLTAPSGLAQQALIRRALNAAGVAPAEIGYVETHGTGTPLGDPIEINALKSVLSEGRTAERPCYIGSVKTNIGHLEAAAGIAGLIRTCLVLHHRAIPLHPLFGTLNPQIRLDDAHFVLPRTHTTLPADLGRLIAGVSSFGFGGSNAHVVLSEAPARMPLPTAGAPSSQERVLTVSAKSPAALVAQVRSCLAHLARSSSAAEVSDVAYTANVGRSHFQHRAAFIGASKAELVSSMSNWLAEWAGAAGPHLEDSPATLVFACDDRRGWYAGLGARLFAGSAPFRDAWLEFAAVANELSAGKGDVQLLRDGPNVGAGDGTLHYLAVVYALHALFARYGIAPGVILGRGAGACLAAHLAGAITLQDAVRLASHGVMRGRSADPSVPYAQWLNEIAVKPSSVPLMLDGGLKARGSLLTVEELVAPRVHGREQALRDLTAATPDILLLEVGPDSGFATAARSARLKVETLSCLRQGQSEWFDVCFSLATLYRRGHAVNWRAFEARCPARRVPIPTYCFERERYWFGSTPDTSKSSGVPARAQSAQDDAAENRAVRATHNPITVPQTEAPVHRPSAERMHGDRRVHSIEIFQQQLELLREQIKLVDALN